MASAAARRVRASVWRDPRVMLGGSDAGAHLDLMCHANYPTVVLGEAVRERELLSLEEAVALMTSRPARHYGLTGRGRVAEGSRADLVVFGHSHIPLDTADESLRIFNPGSPTDRRRQPHGTLGVLRVNDGALTEARIIEVS